MRKDDAQNIIYCYAYGASFALGMQRDRECRAYMACYEHGLAMKEIHKQATRDAEEAVKQWFSEKDGQGE